MHWTERLGWWFILAIMGIMALIIVAVVLFILIAAPWFIKLSLLFPVVVVLASMAINGEFVPKEKKNE